MAECLLLPPPPLHVGTGPYLATSTQPLLPLDTTSFPNYIYKEVGQYCDSSSKDMKTVL